MYQNISSFPLASAVTHTVSNPPALVDHDIAQWNCSHQQKLWMKINYRLQALGLWPGCVPGQVPFSLWRHPPQPELIDTISELPSPRHFQLHPFFIWKPENKIIIRRLRNNYTLPCLYGCTNPQVVSSGVGRPRVIIGVSGQYYIFASRLTCKVCKKYWHADKPQWLEKRPKRFNNIVPAFITHKKAICKSVMDELRRSGRSPEDMAKQLVEGLHLKYERAHLAYLLSVQNIWDAEAGLYGQKTITGLLRKREQPASFGGYGDADGWGGVLSPPITWWTVWSRNTNARSSSSRCCCRARLVRCLDLTTLGKWRGR